MNINTKSGIAIILFNSAWMGYYVLLFYTYRYYTSCLYLYRIPGWILVLNSILGLIGILIGVQVVRGKIKQRRAIFLTVGMLIIGFLIVLNFTMF